MSSVSLGNQMVFTPNPHWTVNRVAFHKARSTFACLAKLGTGFLVGRALPLTWSGSVVTLTAASVCSLGATYGIRKPEKTLRLTVDQLCLIRQVLASLATFGAGFLLAQIEAAQSPTQSSYPVLCSAIGVTALSVFGLVSSHAFQPPKTNHPPLVSAGEVERLGLKEVVHELCEMNSEGEKTPCSMGRLREIIEGLKEKNLLHVLNTAPSRYLERRAFLSGTNQPSSHLDKLVLTPLHYWAHKGNLEAVSLLIAHGALDYCQPGNEIGDDIVSALWWAALAGNEEVTRFLLQTGASADVYFGCISRSFIPFLVFELGLMSKMADRAASCIRIILSHLKEDHPRSLEYQLKIPVASSGENCLAWLKRGSTKIRAEKALELIEGLKALLVEFEAKEDVAFSSAQLRSEGFKVERPCLKEQLEGRGNYPK